VEIKPGRRGQHMEYGPRRAIQYYIIIITYRPTGRLTPPKTDTEMASHQPRPRDFKHVRKPPGRRLLYIIDRYVVRVRILLLGDIRPILLLTRYDFGYLSFYLNNAITITTRGRYAYCKAS